MPWRVYVYCCVTFLILGTNRPLVLMKYVSPVQAEPSELATPSFTVSEPLIQVTFPSTLRPLLQPIICKPSALDPEINR
jgi:hypothetical protein